MKFAAGRPTSLLASLFGRVGALFLLAVLSVGLATFFTAQQRISEVYDGQLIIAANVLRALMSEELAEGAPSRARGDQELEVDDAPLLSAEDRKAFDNFAEWRMFRIWRRGKLVLRSDTGPMVGAAPAPDGFSDVRNGDRVWRVYTLRVPNRAVVVQVGERRDIRLVLVREIAVALALPLLLLIPTAAGLIWLALNGGLKTLRALLAQLGRRSMRDLSPIPLEPWPKDLWPLVSAINGLFRRIERALGRERRFLDDAAHQLRTPLAAVKLQAQMIASEDDPAERLVLTNQLLEGVDRASAMTDSLLTLARLETQTATGPGGDLRAEAVAAISDLALLAERRGVALSFDGVERAPAGDAMLLRLVATNLLENAIDHSPSGGEVSVRVWTHSGAHFLSVTDSGLGLPPSERDRVLERFYRGPGARPSGSGLGLSIVVEALRLLGGRLILGDRADGASGLCATVELPDRGMA